MVLLRAMQEWHLLDTERGRIAIGWLIVGSRDGARAGAAAGAGQHPGTDPGPVTVGSVVGPLLLTLAKVGVFVALMLVIRGRGWCHGSCTGSPGPARAKCFTLAVLAIALGIAYGATALFGSPSRSVPSSPGWCWPIELSHRAAEDSLPLRDAFAVLFFVSVGMLFDPAILIERPLAVLMTFLIIVVGKSLAAYAIVRGSGYTNRTALTISVSLAQIGEFSFILTATLGLETGLLPAEGRT